jgi:hypothetical protein
MSGFLRRLVARHAAEPATRPRALSRFEAGAPPSGGSRPESSAPLSSPEEPAGAYVSRSVGPSADVAAANAAPRSRPDETRPSVTAMRRMPSSEPATAPFQLPFDRMTVDRSFPLPEPVVDPAQVARPFAELLPTPQPRRGAGPIVPRRASVAARAEAPAPGRLPGASGVAAREPDVVRVHIGRVEVRAVLPPAERPAPRPRESAGPLPLDRYLARGGRP